MFLDTEALGCGQTRASQKDESLGGAWKCLYWMGQSNFRRWRVEDCWSSDPERSSSVLQNSSL